MRISIPLISISWHGGIRVLVQVANYLAEQGHEVTILCSRGRVHSPYRISPDVTVRHVGFHTRWKHLDYAIFLASLPFVIPGASVVVATFFVTYFSVRLAALLHGARYVYFVQDVESKYGAGLRGWLLNRFCNYTYRDRNIVAANQYLQERLLREFGCRSKCVQVGPGELFYGAASGRAGEYDVVYFLRREPWKGLDRFKALVGASRGALRFLCVSQDQRLLAEIDDPAVTCIKPVDDRELIACLDSARVCFFSSYKEGFALPPLEAMARGLPVVLFRCGGPDLYVRDGVNSFYVDDTSEAVAIIDRLLRDQSLYAKVSAEARTTAESFRMERALRRFSLVLVGTPDAQL